jgi:DNA polymerase III epsilon subunit-like protein
VEFIAFDTETTGLLGKSTAHGTDKDSFHEVVQFSAIWLNSDFQITRVVNRYCKSNQFISEGAAKANHLTDKLVDVLSNGKYFEQIVDEEGLRDQSDVTWLAYGAPFDMTICNQTLVQNGAPPINFGRSVKTLSFEREGIFNFCVMDTLGRMSSKWKRMKLVDAVEKYLGIERFRGICKVFRKQYGISDPFLSEQGDEDFFHNSIFDCLAIVLLLEICKVPLFE